MIQKIKYFDADKMLNLDECDILDESDTELNVKIIRTGKIKIIKKKDIFKRE